MTNVTVRTPIRCNEARVAGCGAGCAGSSTLITTPGQCRQRGDTIYSAGTGASGDASVNFLGHFIRVGVSDVGICAQNEFAAV